jgi:hypothetical protein
LTIWVDSNGRFVRWTSRGVSIGVFRIDSFITLSYNLDHDSAVLFNGFARDATVRHQQHDHDVTLSIIILIIKLTDLHTKMYTPCSREARLISLCLTHHCLDRILFSYSSWVISPISLFELFSNFPIFKKTYIPLLGFHTSKSPMSHFRANFSYLYPLLIDPSPW